MNPGFEYIYVHMPFCDVICHYCDFYTARTKEALYPEFFQALTLETKAASTNFSRKLKTIYFGGGTPSACPPEMIKEYLSNFTLNDEMEITLEANPTNITRENLEIWRAAGINRISLGIQSLDNQLLKRLGRNHSAEEARTALSLCTEYFSNITGDLIYSVPGQSEEGPANDAAAFADMGLSHISCYHLTIPNTHFLFPKLPSGDFAYNQISNIAQCLEARGFRHYEISNFGKPGFESRNNSNYWSGGPYYALGPSASGFDGKFTRWKNISDWNEYVRRGQANESLVEETEELTQEQRKIETIFTSLRTLKGLNLGQFQREFGEDLLTSRAAILSQFSAQGLGAIDNGHLVLSFRGRMLGDEVAKKLI